MGTDRTDGSWVFPGESIDIELYLANKGLLDLTDVEIFVNITSIDGYVYSLDSLISLDSWTTGSVTIPWQVPEVEGRNYTLTAILSEDNDPRNNEYSFTLRSRFHAFDLSSDLGYQSNRPGSYFSFNMGIKNIGSFPEDNASFSCILPEQWSWRVMNDEGEITRLNVMDQETFVLEVFANGSLGEYQITIIAHSENEVTFKEYVVTIYLVDRDIAVMDCSLFRADGKNRQPVALEDTIIEVTLINRGLQITSDFEIILKIDGFEFATALVEGMDGSQMDNVTFIHNFADGLHNLQFIIDPIDAVKEFNETNNVFDLPVNVKSAYSDVDFTVNVNVLGADGTPISDAEVATSYDSTPYTGITDEEGNVSLIISDSYKEGSLVILETHFNELFGAEWVPLYSEDSGICLTIIVARYGVDSNTDAREIEAVPGENVSFEMDIENLGDLPDKYNILITDVPSGWSRTISGDGYSDIDSTLELRNSEITSITIQFTIGTQEPAYESYKMQLIISSRKADFSTEHVDLFVHITPVFGLSAAPESNISEALPGDTVLHRIRFTNDGNMVENLLLSINEDPGSPTLSKQYLSINPYSEKYVWFTLEVPMVRAGTVWEHRLLAIVQGKDKTIEIDFTTTINKERSTFRIITELKDNELHIENAGNAREYLRIDLSSDAASLYLVEENIELDMMESMVLQVEVIMEDATVPAGMNFPVIVSLFDGEEWINRTLSIPAPANEKFDISTSIEMFNVEAGSTISCPITLLNQGNVDMMIQLSALSEGGVYALPYDPVHLPMGESVVIDLQICVSKGLSGIQDILITASSQSTITTKSAIVTLNITNESEIRFGNVSMQSNDETNYYTIRIYNDGSLEEVIAIEATIGTLDTNTFRIGPSSFVDALLSVPTTLQPTSPIIVSVVSSMSNGEAVSLPLPSPPTPTINQFSGDDPTVRDYILFNANGDYEEYRWFMDDMILFGSEIEVKFPTPGTNDIKLIVTNENGLTSQIKKEVVIANIAPEINCPSFMTGVSARSMEFSAIGSRDPDGLIKHMIWTIGDIQYSGMKVYHAFEKPGSYTVNLTTVDELGGWNTIKIQVTITSNDIASKNAKKEEDSVKVIAFAVLFISAAILGIIFTAYHQMHKKEQRILKEIGVIELNTPIIDPPSSGRSIGGKDMEKDSLSLEKVLHNEVEVKVIQPVENTSVTIDTRVTIDSENSRIDDTITTERNIIDGTTGEESKNVDGNVGDVSKNVDDMANEVSNNVDATTINRDNNYDIDAGPTPKGMNNILRKGVIE